MSNTLAARTIKVLIPLPSRDFDPTEVAVSWKNLRDLDVTFATPDGEVAAEDPRMMSGEGLGAFKFMLRADRAARLAMEELKKTREFNHPITYKDIRVEDFDGILLPGGHAPAMRAYMESTLLQMKVAQFFDSNKPMAAICHGVVLAARSISQKTGKSILYQKNVTALVKTSELLAWNLTKKRLGNYYRTYPDTTVEDEVVSTLIDKKNFHHGPPTLLKDTPTSTWKGFAVVDGNLVTARWPGDVNKFSLSFRELLERNR